MIKVSIIVPVYNSEVYLVKTMDSLVSQTLKEIEIVIINDGSTDRSLEIIAGYRDQNPERIRIFNKENGGQASARNLGIQMSRGKYIGFLDSDDYAEPSMFEKLYNEAIRSDADVTECGYHYIQWLNNQPIELTPYCVTRHYANQKDMFIDPLVSPWNKLYKGRLLKDSGVDFPEGCIYEDTAFYIKGIPYMKSQAYIDEKLIHHYFWEASTMNANRNKKVGDIFIVLDDIISYYQEEGYDQIYYEELEYFCVKILLNSSLGRIFQIKDRSLRHKLIDETLKMIKNNFPDYRKNKYFSNNFRSMYMRSMTKLTMLVYGWFYIRIKK